MRIREIKTIKKQILEVALTKEEIKLLKRLQHGDVTLGKVDFDGRILFALTGCGFAEIWNEEESKEYGTANITEEGTAWLRENRKNDYRFWFPIFITNAISFLALVVAIVALVVSSAK